MFNMVWNRWVLCLFLQSKEQGASWWTDSDAFGCTVVGGRAGIIGPVGGIEIAILLQHEASRRQQPGNCHHDWVDPLDGQRWRTRRLHGGEKTPKSAGE